MITPTTPLLVPVPFALAVDPLPRRASMHSRALALGALVLAPTHASGEGAGARAALREALGSDLRAAESSSAGEKGGWKIRWPPVQFTLYPTVPTPGPTPPTPGPTPLPTPLPVMRQMGNGGCKGALLDDKYVFGTLEKPNTLENLKEQCLGDARCKVMVYHPTGSSLHAFCERSSRDADVWLKVEGPRDGLDLCMNLDGCLWSGGPCETGPGMCDPKSGQCSAPGRKAQGTPCDDGDSFTSNDQCSSYGSCYGQERDCLREPCPASTACKSHFCTNPQSFDLKSYCSYSINYDAKCDDGNAATLDDRCDRDGVCQAVRVGNFSITSLKGCGSGPEAACKGYGRRFGNFTGCFAACADDSECRYVQTQNGSGGDCSLFKKCCSSSPARFGQVYQKPVK
jgi:hypothetical protein